MVKLLIKLIKILIMTLQCLIAGTFYKMELHFSHPIQVLHPIVQAAWNSHLALL